MSQDQLIKLACKVCKRVNYWSRKNRKTLASHKIANQKHCRWCKKHTLHQEVKK